MRNFLFTFQSFHSSNLLKTIQFAICRTSVSSNSFCGSEILRAFSSDTVNNVNNKPNKSSNTSVRILNNFDKVSDNEEKCKSVLIYYGSLTGQIKGVKVFTCLSSLGGIALQPLMVQNLLNGDNLPLSVALLTCVGFFTFVTPFLIHLLTKKYVTEIQYNAVTNTYTATILSFFLRRINFHFKVGDVTVPNILPMFTTMLIQGRPVFVVSDSFLEMDHYIKMMGYDKPIDLKLSNVTPTEDLRKSGDKEKSEIL